MKIAFYTLGCKVNQYETQAMRECFIHNGHTVVSDKSDFDVIIINSCTVTAESDRKTRQILHHFRKERPDAIIALTGCLVQALSDNSSDLEDADIIVGNTDVNNVVESTELFAENGEKIFKVQEHSKTEHFNTPIITEFAERTRAYIKIEDGCDRFCTYCIIPSARGWVRSKPIKEIHEEALLLSKNGFVEIVIVGINLSSYGKGEEVNICDAVDTVCSVDKIKRVRLGSLEPDLITDEMLKRLKGQNKFCPQFHLSLQSGCDETLKRMNRHYDTEFYYDLVSRIRNNFSDSAITTDIMVGFAGESEEEFKKSLEFVKKVGFSKSHIFAYSKRKGTMAFNMNNQISKSDKSKRSKEMIDLTNKSEQHFLSSYIGKILPVLFEEGTEDCAIGYTENYIKVHVKTEENLCGSIRDVKIEAALQIYCTAKLV